MSDGDERFALRCAMDGGLLTVIRDDGGIFADIDPGRLFPSLVEGSCMGVALDFLVEIRREGAAFDHEFSFAPSGGRIVVHCIGARLGDGILIAGSSRREGILELYDDLISLSNEQGSRIRALEKQLVERGAPFPDGSAEQDDELLFSDVTRLNNELVSAQRELARKNAELSRTDEIKNRFLGMATHDLRSPLALIIAYSDTMLDSAGASISSSCTVYLERIRSSAVFMSELVDDLLDTAAIESGRLRLEPYPHDMVDLVTRCVEMGQIFSARKGVVLQFSPPAEKITAVVDEVRIAQALNNLLSNSVKFSPPEAKVHIQLSLKGEDVVIVVEDHGAGIPRQVQEKVFSPFGTPTIRSPSGEKSTGLGLLIAKRVAEAHHGRLELDSEPGRGTRVELTIPRTGMLR
jgi:signal transduction histidine kinase